MELAKILEVLDRIHNDISFIELKLTAGDDKKLPYDEEFLAIQKNAIALATSSEPRINDLLTAIIFYRVRKGRAFGPFGPPEARSHPQHLSGFFVEENFSDAVPPK